MIRPISYEQLCAAPNAGEILKEYSDECALPELGDACPHNAIYEALEKSGGMQVFGVYHGDYLVGFSIVLTYIQPHYGKKVATTESIFIEKAYRTTGLGKDLLTAIESYAKEKGCEIMLSSAPAGSRFSRLLELDAANYRRSHSVYLRKL